MQPVSVDDLHPLSWINGKFTSKTLQCSKQARPRNNGMGLRFYFVNLGKRGCDWWEHWYGKARGKFPNRHSLNYCESIWQECIHELKTKVRDSTGIRYLLIQTINYGSYQSDCVSQMTCRAASSNSKLLGSEGSMVVKLKLKEIERRRSSGLKPLS